MYYNIHNITIFVTILLILLLVSSAPCKRSAEINVEALSYDSAEGSQIKSDNSEECDIFSGKWVTDPNAPYYTNTACWAIYESEDCLKNGTPDLGFLKWRWKPDGCDLAVFDPYLFLNLVEAPVDVSKPDNPYSSWKYGNYNFTVVNLRSPFLIRLDKPDSDHQASTEIFKLHLDELDDSWTSQIDEFDYIVLNVGHWYTHTAIYHEKRRVIGCYNCQTPNITELPQTRILGPALRTAFKSINSRRSFHGVTFLCTFSPSHFKGKWNEGGDCPWPKPFTKNETVLEGFFLDIYETQLKEFRAVERVSGKKFRLLDMTRAMLMRPDGHPSRYRYGPNERSTVSTIADCLQKWCLPDPIDSWSDFLLHMMKMEKQKSSDQVELFNVNKKMMLSRSEKNK